MKRYDAVVIGAGHHGLTAAAYLARGGLRTLVVERRDVVGGCCVTEEIAPGCRASTTSYIASMLRPEVIRDLELKRHGLAMVPCEPGLQVPFPDGELLSWWPDTQRTANELARFSTRDAEEFVALDAELKRLARYLQPFFMRPPPDVGARGLDAAYELVGLVKNFWGISGREVGQLLGFLTRSLAELVDERFESDRTKTLILANNVYGKHGGPYQKGTALGLLFHLLSGGDHEEQSFYGHVMGGMGAITQAMAAACRERGVEIRTGSPVARIEVREGRARAVTLEDGTELHARLVLSGADPKRTFLGMVDEGDLPTEFRRAVAAIKMDGPCAKVNFVLSEEPRVSGMPPEAGPGQRALFTLVPSLEYAERSYESARRGELSDDLWVDCVVASNVDSSLAPADRHVMTCFVQYVPYRLANGGWDAARERLGEVVVNKIAEYAPNVPSAVVARQVLTPLDLERTYGLTEGNIFHDDLSLDQLFFMRPVSGWARYATPIAGLYLCGAGAHPGGGVTGAPGYNAARRALADVGRL